MLRNFLPIGDKDQFSQLKCSVLILASNECYCNYLEFLGMPFPTKTLEILPGNWKFSSASAFVPLYKRIFIRQGLQLQKAGSFFFISEHCSKRIKMK